ncbi:MAG: glycosyltransferase [Bacteroidota bacterium]
MKILLVMTPSFDATKGGVQRIVEKIGGYFASQGHQVYFYSTKNSGHIAPHYGTLEHAQEPGGPDNAANLTHLRAVLQKYQPDVVLNEMPYEHGLRRTLKAAKEELGFLLLGCLNNSLFSVKNNLAKYATEVLPGWAGRLLNNALGHRLLLAYHKRKHSRDLQAILEDNDLFVLPTASQANVDELRYFVGDFGADKVAGIPNSIPGFRLDQVAKKEKVLLYVGRLNNSQKRSDLLLPVWRELVDQLPDWKFEIVGDGPYLQELRKQLAKAPVDRVYLRGFQVPTEYYERAAIFIMPSSYEGFPSVLLEAQSNGVIPVAFDSYPALSWIVNDGQDACLIPAFNTTEMAAAILRLAQDEKSRARMREACRTNARRFTIDQVGEQWLELFEKYTGELV